MPASNCQLQDCCRPNIADNIMEHFWVQSSSADHLPKYAVVGGYDCDSDPIYVGRANHQGDKLSAKVIPGKGCAYVAWGGQEHSKDHYEVLVGPGYGWRVCKDGHVPHNAVPSGHTSQGEPLYVGRGHHLNSLSVGKVHPSHGCLYIPFGGREISLDTYEVLVCENNDNWEASALGLTPAGAVVAGYDSDGTAIYVARSWHDGEMLPAKFVPERSEAYVGCDGCEIHKSDIKVLCGHNYTWIKTNIHDIPQNAVFTGRSKHGDPLFVGRAHHNGSLTPGLVSLNEQCLIIPYGGTEVRKNNFEVLARQ